MDEEHIDWNDCPEVNILREFIDIDAWLQQTPESLERRYPFVQITKASVAESDDADDDLDIFEFKEYSLHLNVPESVLKMLLDVLEHEGWDVDLDDAELINGWYEDVYIFKQVAVGIDQ